MNTARRRGESIVTGRRTGRPRGNARPLVPYEEVDRALVFGESVLTDDGKGTTLVFPSYRDLALRYGVSNSIIAAYSKKHNCLKRREVAQARIEAKADEKLVELRAEALALSRDDELRIIDSYLAGFEKALADGSIRFDDPGHFDRLCRLKEFLLGGADSRQEVHAALSLEDLQAKHRQMLRQVEESSAAERRDPDLALPAAPAPRPDPPALRPAPPPGEPTGQREAVSSADGETGLFGRGAGAASGAPGGGSGEGSGDRASAPQGANEAPTRRSVAPDGDGSRTAGDAAPDLEDER